MKVLVACEFSGIVRDAFLAKGHDAVSCDLIKSERPGPHIQGDALEALRDSWDMMLAFPPCTHLAASGARWFAEKQADGRQAQGIYFFMALVQADHIPRICVENPVGIMSSVYRKPDQIVEPWMFGEEVSKKTCLWLKGLPLLRSTDIVSCGEKRKFQSGRSMSKWYYDTWNLPVAERAKVRGKTFQGIACAMAEQWGSLEGDR